MAWLDNKARLEKLRADARALMNEDTSHLEGWRSQLHRFVHFWTMVVRGFNRNRCPERATALAYATLLALIPMLAVVVSVTSTFLKKEGEDRIDMFIEQVVANITPPALLSTNVVATTSNVTVTVTTTNNPNASIAADSGLAPGRTSSAEAELGGIRTPQTNVTEITTTGTTTNQVVLPSFLQQEDAIQARRTVAKSINHFIQNTRSGALGVTGSILLIFAAISMLSRIEMTFNDIWGVEKGRSWFMRVVLYWGVITLAPLLLVVALGLATGPHLDRTKELLLFSPFLANLLFRILPVLLLALTFSAFYMMMPNTRVSWRAALAGGVTAGILFHLNNMFSLLYVSRVVSNSKIYGSLGLVPVLMIGLYFSWLFLLFGAQVAYGYQNRAVYLEEKLCEHINQRGREFVAFRLMTSVGQRFESGLPPLTGTDLAHELSVPSRLVRQTMQTLVSARLVVESAGAENGYMPARPLETVTCHDVLEAMRAQHGTDLATRDEPCKKEVYGEFARIQEAERRAASEVSILGLVRRVETAARPEISDVTVEPSIGRVEPTA